ncbi:7009_t:CDS:2, partial [Dentiscutata heterogama]
MCIRPCKDDKYWCTRCSERKPKIIFKKFNGEDERIVDIQYIADGGFSSVCTAKWLDGYPREQIGLRSRKGLVTVALKIFKDGYVGLSADEPPFNNIQHDALLILSICGRYHPDIINNTRHTCPYLESVEMVKAMIQEKCIASTPKRNLTKKHSNTAYARKFISIIINNENSDIKYIYYSRRFSICEF